MKLSENIKNLKGIGEKTSALFGKVGVFSLWDLMLYIPRDFVRYPELTKVSELKVGQTVAAALTVQTDPTLAKAPRLTILSAKAADDTGSIRMVWFNMPYMKKSVIPGLTRVFYGKVGLYRNQPVLEHPKMFEKAEYEKMKNVLEPVYPLTKGLGTERIKKTVSQVFELCFPIKDYLPEEDVRKLGLMDLSEAIRTVHSPAEEEIMKRARKRLAFDEYLAFLISVKEMKEENLNAVNNFPIKESDGSKKIIESLPYKLTNAQLNTYHEIINDMSGKRAMNRLVQGDVGSGKTIVALLAMVSAVENGYQAAMMAPTEVLAAQHASKIKAMLEEYELPIKTVLLSGSLTAKEKREAKAQIATGEARIIVGTQALIQDGVEFDKLALVVTDEQHRFGVKQRETLAEKAGTEDGELKSPHVLVMSATPIPRTLAIILYGDLDISVMNELPNARLPIKNCVVGPEFRKKAYEFIEKETAAGHQAYVICPQVEESEVTESENVIEYTERLKSIFGSRVRVEMLHGKMKPKEKNQIMERFAAHEIDVLVSTTVIEVGVDVPNSTVMMIENAEKFGLAQLHQIRGRVGRGTAQGYCIFLNTSKSKEDNKRLKILNESNDGFKIASEDLKLRGPGDFFGIRQSGLMNFRIADVYNDADMLKAASEYVKEISDDTKEALNELAAMDSHANQVTL
ncbi:MAG: ATP-dependent DNA helicase RecG [Lachnospiraceae bacterium]|nr:ATP-dependent DNA helicase RecG [Lachnospiraceae bacterium]